MAQGPNKPDERVKIAKQGDWKQRSAEPNEERLLAQVPSGCKLTAADRKVGSNPQSKQRITRTGTWSSSSRNHEGSRVQGQHRLVVSVQEGEVEMWNSEMWNSEMALGEGDECREAETAKRTGAG